MLSTITLTLFLHSVVVRLLEDLLSNGELSF